MTPMPLDFVDTAAQIEGMADELRSRREIREQRLRNALAVMRDFPMDAYEERRRRGDFGPAAPQVKEPPDAVHGLPEAPADHAVVAVDGSHIDVDRHLAARCFLINTGSVVLAYGSRPGVEMEGRARLYARAGEMVVPDPGGGVDQRIEGAVLGAKRTAEEMLRLVEVVRALPGDVPTLALVDGPLVMLGLIGRGYGDFVRRELVEEGFAAALEELGALADERPLAVAGYVSMPGYSEAAAALRYAVCEYDGSATRCEAATAPCDGCVGDVQDRALFARLLGSGERSGLFGASSGIIRNHYRGMGIDFFYVNTGDEIARIEVPSWTSGDEAALALAHSLAVDQAQRGRGYPVALMEAHEKAVINTADRRYFTELVEQALYDRDVTVETSEKALSKRLRWL